MPYTDQNSEIIRPFRPYLDEFREIVEDSIWSRAVSEARTAEFAFENRGKEIFVILRLSREKRAVRTSFSLEDNIYSTNCSCENDPCIHLLVASIKGNSDWNSSYCSVNEIYTHGTAPQLEYHLYKAESDILIKRYIVQPDGSRAPFSDSLVEYVGGISSGRIKSEMPLVSSEDYAVDQALGRLKKGLIEKGFRSRALKALSVLSSVYYEDIKVNVNESSECYSLISHIKNDQVVISPAKSKGETLYLNGYKLLWWDEVDNNASSIIENGRNISFEELADFLVNEIPYLAKYGIIINPPDENGWPRIMELPVLLKFSIREIEEGFSVSPRIIYGDPPVAELTDQGFFQISRTIVPKRDSAKERSHLLLIKRLLGLFSGNTKLFSGHQALLAAEKLYQSSLKGECSLTGDSLDNFLVSLLLEPCLEESDEGIKLKFNISGQDSLRSEAGALIDQEITNSINLQDLSDSFDRGEVFFEIKKGTWARLPEQFLKESAQFRSSGFGIEWGISEGLKGESNSRSSKPKSAKFIRDRDDFFTALKFAPFLGEKGVLAVHNHLERASSTSDSSVKYQLPENITLRSYQKEGIAWLGGLSRIPGAGALLADDMGLGKTLQAILSLQFPALIIVPTSLISQWESEVRRFYPEVKLNLFHGSSRKCSDEADITITTYGLIRSDVEELKDINFSTIVVDEAQNIKNPESQAHIAVCELRGNFKICLTGTPVENSATDLWSLFRFIMPGLLPPLGKFGEILQKENGPLVIKKILSPFIKRREKDEVLTELPPRTEVVIPCVMSENQSKLYDQLKSNARESADQYLEKSGDMMGFFELLLRLRQICVDPALAGADSKGEAVKIDTLLELLVSSSEAGHKSLVFSQWTSALDIIEPRIKREIGNCLRLDGQTVNRDAVVQEFKSNPNIPVMLLSLKAGGVGLNLTEADHVFFLDSWWNPAVERQAADRVHRIGQDKPVFIYKLVIKDSIEEKIMELHSIKSSISDALLGSLPDSGKLSKEDLLYLLS
ncbi:MAG TPA: DEAD/DEAH box helicase [Oligoflexia bacterium]|nr:DEAD/DEAH box helicase [Oligoflexia bacterium]HMP47173.1 DEAD/DEAH box helicase [Oligoflexia bacterium]